MGHIILKILKEKVLKKLKESSYIKWIISIIAILLVVVLVVQTFLTTWVYLGAVSALSTFLLDKKEVEEKKSTCAWAIRKVGVQGEITDSYSTGVDKSVSYGNVGEYDPTATNIDKMNDVTILARLIAAEGGTNKFDSLLVGAVALNRTKVGYKSWGNTLASVIKARNQYSTYPKRFYAAEPTQENILSAKQVLSGLVPLATAVVFQSQQILGELFVDLREEHGNAYSYSKDVGVRTKDAFGNPAKSADEIRQIANQLKGNTGSISKGTETTTEAITNSTGSTAESSKEIDTNTTSTGVVKDGYQGTAGKDSGLFSNLLTDAEKHKNEYWYSLVNDVGKPPNKVDMSAKQYSGSKAYQYNKQGNALYAQAKSKKGSVSTYSTDKYNGSNTIGGAGCGICSLAMTLTSLSGKVVNPAEIIVAGHTYGDRHAGKSSSNIFSGVITGTGIVNLATDAGFKAERIGSFEQSKIDAALNQGAYIIYATVNSSWGWGSGNHYITITDKDNEGKYHIIDSANIWKNGANEPFSVGTTFEKIKASDTGQGVEIIYPRTDLLGEANTTVAPTGQKIQTGVKYIMYHTGNPNCEMHNGVYCSCGLDAAYDSTKEYELFEEVTGSVSITASDTGSSDTTGGKIGTSKYTETAGQFQGVWGGKTTKQILSETAVHGGKNLDVSFIEKYAGTANAYFKSGYKKDLDPTYGVPYFAQGGYTESWTNNISLTGGSGNTLYTSGCAVYMWASITSKLTGKLVNPPEMLGILYHYGVLNSNGEYKADTYGINDLMGLIGYKVNAYTKSNVTDSAWKSADEALAQGIPQGFRTSTPSSHYFVITAKTNDGKYKVYQGVGIINDSKTYTREALQGLMYSDRTSFFVVTRK